MRLNQQCPTAETIDIWRDWDLNPGTDCSVTDFPGLRLQPLGHLSRGNDLQLYYEILENANI